MIGDRMEKKLAILMKAAKIAWLGPHHIEYVMLDDADPNLRITIHHGNESSSHYTLDAAIDACVTKARGDVERAKKQAATATASVRETETALTALLRDLRESEG